ncbi:MAG: ABC transporter ATP-binding protein [Candidatus Krumholzibacteriia bacterium]
MAVLELENISKSFSRGFWGRKLSVLTGLSLRIERGEVFGLLGHNGAGKSTTMRVILGLLRPDAGRISLFGGEGASRASRARIGFLGDENGLYPHFNAREMMQLTGQLLGMNPAVLKDRQRELLAGAGLEAHSRIRIKKYSKGMRQRLAIALTILGDPEFLILDEPYSGLDPIGRRQVRRLLLGLKERGKTILLSSHIVPDVEAVCDRVGILRDGHVSKCLALDHIFREKSSSVEVTVSGVDPADFEGASEMEKVYHHDRALVLRCRGRETVRAVISRTYELGGEVLEVKPLKFNLEDYLFEALTSEPPAAVEAAPVQTKDRPYAHHR